VAEPAAGTAVGTARAAHLGGQQVQREQLQRGGGLEQALPLVHRIQGHREGGLVVARRHQPCRLLHVRTRDTQGTRLLRGV